MRVVVVAKKSTYAQLSEESWTSALLKKPVLRKALRVHQRHCKALEQLKIALKSVGIRPWILEGADKAFDVKGIDLVITLGGDGTLLSASHHVGAKTPILGINSDPSTSVGYFCAVKGPITTSLLCDVLRGRYRSTQVTRMEVLVRGHSVTKRVLNEALLSHACPAATSKFMLRRTMYRCSGAWIGTGAGSTGAIHSAGGEIRPLTSKLLQAIVREPYGTDDDPSGLIGHQFQVISRMTEAFLYIDGPFLQVPVGLGDRVTFRVSSQPLTLIGRKVGPILEL